MRAYACMLAVICLSIVPRAFAHDLPSVTYVQPAYVQPANSQTVYVQAERPQIVQTVPPPAQFAYVEDREPSALAHSLRGLLAGSLVGAAVGHLATLEDSGDEPWRGVLLGAGIGALSGAGLGLSLGLLDAADGADASAHYLTRDALYGTMLGGVFGSIAGGLVALDSDDADDVLVGASIGAIAGVVLGSLVGVVEGQLRTSPRRARRVSTTIVVSQDSAGQRLLIPSLRGSF